jgi:hypothetical protein
MMNEMDRREALLKQDGYILGIASFSLLNGMHFSPYFEHVVILFGPILRGFEITSPVITFYLTSLLMAVGSVMIAGIPAAIFERVTERQQSDSTSLLIWLVSIFILALPSLGRLLGFN